ncbi:penicillin-binding protein 2 [Rubritalea squalenifaciens DSM 18772]|uniref:Beta-lactamase n=1 Tax=Rubritalea squalenifaciens DSM 18772 TaxID=1123071 RepID=A0A1M6LCF2_9BACT|nr:penicillin-binding protein 2 [Rubritalea squalenifaciens]SHJ68775.1 penicillin-binding protein 2 [Rubritalea squalenifaciens DSM 18772]
MKQPRYRYRLYLLTLLVLVGCGVLLTKLYEVQIERQEEFRELMPDNYEVRIREPGVRGEITDRNGVTLAKNLIDYQVVFDLEEIHRDYLEHSKSEKTEEEEDTPEEKKDIVAIINEWVRPRLAVHGLDTSYSARALSAHYKTHGGLVPYVFRDDLTYEQFAHFAEHNLELPGVYVRVAPRRVYPFGALGSHVVGFLKQWEKGDVPPEFKHYIGDARGIEGIEATLDQYLRGSEGIRTILKDEKGKTLRDVDYMRPGPGSEVALTIDARVQYLTESVLRRAGRAAAVVMDPRTGEVLAMASVPDFDPNDFIPAITTEKYQNYRSNKGAPFLNRAISNFPPGSTFKIPTAIAGCLNGQHGAYCNCIGYTAYGKAKIRCWKTYGHGNLGLAEAIQRSCNPYFMKMANTMGPEKMVETFQNLGLGKTTGIRLPNESPGILPGSIEWQRRFRDKSMTPAFTGMLSIGQGDSEATPLQMASIISAVANGGRFYQPRIVRSVTHPTLGVQIADRAKLKADLLKEGLDPTHLETIRTGMRLAANKVGGTARRASLADIVIGAKTGTAQTVDLGIKTHVAWTVAFAPYDSPRYVVVVAVKRGSSGGAVAGPLVKLILTGLFAQEEGHKLPLAKLSPYQGNLDIIDAISLPDDNQLAATFSDNGETGDEASSIVIVKPEPEVPENLPNPTIKPEVDQRGSVIPRAIPVQE